MKGSLITFASTLSLLTTPVAAQDSVAAFYKGKQLRLIVGSGVGGGYDLYTRALARHIVNHIPGSRPSSCRTSRPPAAW